MARFFVVLLIGLLSAAASAAPVTIDFGSFGASIFHTGQTQEVTFSLLVLDTGVSDWDPPTYALGSTLFTPADNGDHTIVLTSANTPDWDAATALLTDNIASIFAIHLQGIWQIVDFGDGPELVDYLNVTETRTEGFPEGGFLTDLPDTLTSITIHITNLSVAITHVVIPGLFDDFFNGATMNVSITFSDEPLTVPEPAALPLLGVGATALLRRRRR